MKGKWKSNHNFPGGKEDWATAAAVAEGCLHFHPDVEEEQMADEVKSCYNCRYRRWTVESFVCHKEQIIDLSKLGGF